MRGQIAAACQECYRVHKDAKHIWVNMEVDVRIIDRMAWWDESYIFKATRLSRVSKKPTDQNQILKKTDQQQWINKKKIKWITAEAGAFNNHGSAQIQHCEAFCVAKVRLLHVTKANP